MSNSGTRSTPLRAIDGHVRLDGREIVAEKMVKSDDPYLSGHFPDFTLYPAVFLIEGVSQMLDEHLAAVHGGNDMVNLVEVRTARFTAPMLVGDMIEIRGRLELGENIADIKAVCTNSTGVKVGRIDAEFSIVRRSPGAGS
ncbi:hypothetical protein ACIBCN_41360 [Nocardia sp. NPDC051052]|uniref:hypothetical protein n=1 Tax=Nocardia sp. NPDC051052 TaxID=3364322 RepID=UPI00379AE45C